MYVAASKLCTTLASVHTLKKDYDKRMAFAGKLDGECSILSIMLQKLHFQMQYSHVLFQSILQLQKPVELKSTCPKLQTVL